MAKQTQGYFPVSVLLSAEKYRALKRLVAKGQYKTVAEAVRAAVDAFLERLEQEGRKAKEG